MRKFISPILLVFCCWHNRLPQTAQICYLKVLWLRNPTWVYWAIIKVEKAISFLTALRENPFPFSFQLLETAGVPELLVPFPSSEPAMQHLSDHVPIVTSLSHTQEKSSPLLRIRVI